MKDEIKNSLVQKTKSVSCIFNTSIGRLMTATMVLVTGVTLTSSLAQGGGNDFFLCDMFGNGGSNSGLTFTPQDVVRGIIFGAPIVGLLGGAYQYFSAQGSGDAASLKQVWKPAAVGLAIPIGAIMIDSLTTDNIACMWG